MPVNPTLKTNDSISNFFSVTYIMPHVAREYQTHFNDI